jgi:hypothetical protein
MTHGEQFPLRHIEVNFGLIKDMRTLKSIITVLTALMFVQPLSAQSFGGGFKKMDPQRKKAIEKALAEGVDKSIPRFGAEFDTPTKSTKATSQVAEATVTSKSATKKRKGEDNSVSSNQNYETMCVLDKMESFNVFFSSTDFYSFSEGMAFVSYKNKWGAINSTGKLVIPFKYDSHDDFSEGLAAISLNGKWGFVNKQGTIVVPTKYESVEKFKEGLACVQINGKYGAINKQGLLVIPAKYDYSFSFNEGIAIIQMNGKYGFINKQGTLVIPCKYTSANDFSEGMAAVERDSVWGYIDKEGKVVLPFDFFYAGSFSNGLAKATHKNFAKGLAGGLSVLLTLASGQNYSCSELIDKYGKEVDYGVIGNFSEGLYSIKDMKIKKSGFKDKSGTLIIPYEYDEAEEFSGGLAKVKKGDKYGYINKQGKVIVPFVYDLGGDFHDGAAWVKKNGKYGYVNNMGKEITPFVFDDLSSFNDGFACVEMKGKFGFIDKNGNPLDLDLDKSTISEIAMGLVRKHDNETEKDKKDAIKYPLLKWLRKGAEKGDYDCCATLGYIYYIGACGLDTNYVETVKWYEKTLPRKDSNGNNFKFIGYCYGNGGYGIEKDAPKAFQYFLEGAKFNNEDCFYALAVSYLNGLGCTENPQLACNYADKLYTKNKERYASIYAACYNALAYDFFKKNNYNQSIVNIDKAINANSSPRETANYYDSKGEFYMKMGKLDEAIKMWNKVMELDKDNLDFYKNSSELYKQLKAKGKI